MIGCETVGVEAGRVGADNLAANGLELPQVVGVIFRGTALGDWTLLRLI